MGTEWGDVATWVTGITSILLFLVAFWQIKLERDARQKAEKERQLADRRYQSERIAAWIKSESHYENRGNVVCVAISNRSLQPIYNVIVQGIVIFDDGSPRADPFPENRSLIAVVPPGIGYTTFPFNYHGMFRRPRIEIAFQDTANRYWLRNTKGELTELDVSPIAHYEIPLPVGWSMLKSDCPQDNEPNN